MSFERIALLNKHASLASNAEMLAVEWLDHHANGRENYKRDINRLLDANNRERKKIERRLRKKFEVTL